MLARCLLLSQRGKKIAHDEMAQREIWIDIQAVSQGCNGLISSCFILIDQRAQEVHLQADFAQFLRAIKPPVRLSPAGSISRITSLLQRVSQWILRRGGQGKKGYRIDLHNSCMRTDHIALA